MKMEPTVGFGIASEGDVLTVSGARSSQGLRAALALLALLGAPETGARSSEDLLHDGLAATGGSLALGEPILEPRKVRVPVSVVQALGPGSGPGSACLDCRTGEWRSSDANRPARFPAAPRIDITTKGAFSFDVAFFSHLGAYVNRARGVVTEAMLAGVPADAQGNKRVALMWYPVSEDGDAVGTGVYIAQGTYRSLEDGDGSLSPVTRRIDFRFGYVRR